MWALFLRGGTAVLRHSPDCLFSERSMERARKKAPTVGSRHDLDKRVKLSA